MTWLVSNVYPRMAVLCGATYAALPEAPAASFPNGGPR